MGVCLLRSNHDLLKTYDVMALTTYTSHAHDFFNGNMRDVTYRTVSATFVMTKTRLKSPEICCVTDHEGQLGVLLSSFYALKDTLAGGCRRLLSWCSRCYIPADRVAARQ